MEALVVAMENPELSQHLRNYSVHKYPAPYTGFGIAFHTEDIAPSKPTHKLVYPLVEVEQSPPALEAGMQNGQRVVAVNGEFVARDLLTLDDVVRAIEDSYYTRNFTEITVLDPNIWDEFMEDPNLAAQFTNFKRVEEPGKNLVSSFQILGVNSSLFFVDFLVKLEIKRDVPRLCRLSRENRGDQYGFDFKTLRNEGRHVANNVRLSFPADVAGLKDGDYILEVNGESVDGVEHDSVIGKISAKPNEVDLLVVSDIDAYLKSLPPKKPEVEVKQIEIPSDGS